MSEELEPTQGEVASTEAAEPGASQVEEEVATQLAETGEQVASGEQVAEEPKVPSAVRQRFSDYAQKLRDANSELETAARERDELREKLAAMEGQSTTTGEEAGNLAIPAELSGMEYDPSDHTVLLDGQWVPAEPIVRTIRAEQRAERVERRLDEAERAQRQSELDEKIKAVTRDVTDKLQTERARVFGDVPEADTNLLDNVIGLQLRNLAPKNLASPEDVDKLFAAIPTAVEHVKALMGRFSNEQIKANLEAAASQVPAAEGLAGVQGKKRLVDMTKVEQEAYYEELDKQAMIDTLRSGP